MEETLRLIRLLVEAPAEEPLLDRPKELIERLSLDDRVKAPVVPLVGPQAETRSNPQQTGPQGQAEAPAARVGAYAVPKDVYGDIGATADPKTGMPNVGYDAQLSILQAAPGPAVQVRSPIEMAGKSATPSLLEAIAGRRAEVRPGETIVATAQATPKTSVTMIVPSALPFDADAAFRDADQTEPSVPFPDGKFSLDWGIPPFDPMQTSAELATQVYSTHLPDDVRYTL